MHCFVDRYVDPRQAARAAGPPRPTRLKKKKAPRRSDKAAGQAKGAPRLLQLRRVHVGVHVRQVHRARLALALPLRLAGRRARQRRRQVEPGGRLQALQGAMQAIAGSADVRSSKLVGWNLAGASSQTFSYFRS